MDFFDVVEHEAKGKVELFPSFKVVRSSDLMLRGRAFYAIWDKRLGLWSTDEYAVAQFVDDELMAYKDSLPYPVKVKTMRNFSSGSWKQFRSFLLNLSDSSEQLDEELTFANTVVKKEDYRSKRLPYDLAPGDFPAWEEIVSTLYDPEERAKIEWTIGAILSGDSKYIQKFLVLYGPGGKGKSTILNIMQMLFEGYYATFDAKALGSTASAFSTAVFKDNPLVAIQHDGDLSKIEDNTKLNSIVAHEEVPINEKYKPGYAMRLNAFLCMGTNKPVKITDAKSGIIRRLIDARPSGRWIETARYHVLMNQVAFELGAIAHHCLSVYRKMGREYYSTYQATEMMLQTDFFFNFIEAHYDLFRSQDGTTLEQAYALYKTFCEESGVEFKLPRHHFRDELGNYFRHFSEREMVDGVRLRSRYKGFRTDKFSYPLPPTHAFSLVLDQKESLLDELLHDAPAQLAVESKTRGTIPGAKWSEVTTTLADVDTSQVHYVKPPLNHIVIDFDLKDENGNKSAERNLEEASKWPPTYAEFSKSGGGVHLHYNYQGDATELSRVFAEGIEVKVFVGDSSLRRKLTGCNSIPVATISSGLPIKEKKMLDFDGVRSERALRALIEKNLRKEIHPGTKPSMDFIHKLAKDAYESGMTYDLTNMRPRIMAFAMNSTNQADYCVDLLSQIKWQSDPNDVEAAQEREASASKYDDDRLCFFDLEVYSNLFVVSWKFKGDKKKFTLVNPTAKEISQLFRYKLVGFNNRRYDNHILYAAFMGYDNAQLYDLSQRLINNSKNATFSAAYELSYMDLYDVLSVKMSLKAWQVLLKIHHMEIGIPWDKPVPEEQIPLVVEYCENDVETTEQVEEARAGDIVARQILAELSGLPLNATTQQHVGRIVFGQDREPQRRFVYTDLSKLFPGYTYELGKSSYRGVEPGEGGFVYAEPGMYDNVAVLDVASMHPNSIRALNVFGPYTKNFTDLVDARVAIKHKDFDAARGMLNGKLAPYLGQEEDAEALSYALKIVINIVYGMTSARFDNLFRDPRNKDNIVAKRGALFMVDLLKAVQEKGFQVVHIKTDSIKIPNATDEIIQFVMEFGQKYGYTFEHETTYEKMCLVNDAVFIAKDGGKWKPTGAQFAHPYVLKTLFTHEPLEFDDFVEKKQTMSSMYIDFESDKPMVDYAGHELTFIGKHGSFVPVTEGGGLLFREKDGKYYAVTGTKGYRWLPAESVRGTDAEKTIDMSYFNKLVDNAIDTINKFGDAEAFLDKE